jgi:hypothetical protein
MDTIFDFLQTAYARGLPRRTGGAASAVGMAWPLAAACGRGSGAKRLFEFPIRQEMRIIRDNRRFTWRGVLKWSRAA